MTSVTIPELNTAIAHLRDAVGDQTYESLARKGETTTTAAMATYALGLAAPAQAATAVNTPISVASAINIPIDFGHHARVVDIQPQVNAPHR